ncbi:calcium-activated chloride channel regulator 1-like [Dreissena polymorpha]|uniref:calcium-activated chloride channel regulator 1-like n=1 Tax=Dreissena polymorpha TaxID=45954 RepID=UPI002263E78B|nr:calcium-activated chloride channel regulator 1-like [Dreissena polymorpha]
MSKMCSFCPHLQQTANASIMGYQNIPSVNFFCDKDDPSVPAWQRHNKKAPTKQNIRCNGKSAWEVMREHSDFRTGSTLPEQTNTEPIFEVLQETSPIRVFVLDTSGSMSTDDKIGNLHRAGTYIINRVLEEDSWLGVVCFNDYARTTAIMTHIISDSDKKNLVASLPTSAHGGTCIGCGILHAIDMLKIMPRNTAENAEIILMSDGVDGNAQALTNARRKAIESKVVIHTVSISQQADQRMISLARDTGGKHYTFLDKGDISFSAIFSQVITISATDMTSKPETLLFKSVDEQSVKINFNFTLETGMNTTISVLTKLSYSVNLTLEITGQSVMRYQSFNGTSLTYQIPETFEAGQYQVIVTSGRVTSWEYTVSSLQSGSNQIMTTTRLSKTTMDFTNSGRDMPVVLADVTKGFAPVTNVDVVAFVEGSENVLCNITLRDNGQEPDTAVDDGTYSAFILPSCMASKRLTLRVEVFGRKGQAGVQKKLRGAIAIEEPEVEYEVLKQSFQRFSIPESLFIENLPADLDLPPGRITDLSVVPLPEAI